MPTVGSTYRNNIVTNIDEEVNDLKNGKVKIRRLITLDDGMIVVEDALYDFEEIVGEYKELQYNEIDFPDISPTKMKSPKKSPKKKKKKDKESEDTVPAPPDLESEDDGAEEELKRRAEEAARRKAEENARLEAEETARREAEESARLEEEERRRREAEEQARRAAEEQARLEEEERRRREAEEERRRREIEEADRIRRLRANWKPQKMVAYTGDNEDRDDPVRSAWRLPSENEIDTS
ncbi:MAG: hypothetical protein SGILL_009287, partial [Bacillariaceae sp.]